MTYDRVCFFQYCFPKPEKKRSSGSQKARRSHWNKEYLINIHCTIIKLSDSPVSTQIFLLMYASTRSEFTIGVAAAADDSHGRRRRSTSITCSCSRNMRHAETVVVVEQEDIEVFSRGSDADSLSAVVDRDDSNTHMMDGLNNSSGSSITLGINRI